MCSPFCLEALYGSASRRVFVKKSMMAAAVVCGARAASGAAVATPAAQQPRTFTTVLDLTHPLYEGFPTFDGSKWFTKEKKFTFAKEKLNINTWTVVEHTGTHMDAPLQQNVSRSTMLTGAGVTLARLVDCSGACLR
jgi:hypothetical protein